MVVALVASVDEAAASASAASRYSVSSCECQRGPKSGLYLIVVASPLCKSLTTTVLFGCLRLRCSAASMVTTLAGGAYCAVRRQSTECVDGSSKRRKGPH
jgi:hypothetical protein